MRKCLVATDFRSCESFWVFGILPGLIGLQVQNHSVGDSIVRAANQLGLAAFCQPLTFGFWERSALRWPPLPAPKGNKRLDLTATKEGVQIRRSNTELMASTVANVDRPQFRTLNPAHTHSTLTRSSCRRYASGVEPITGGRRENVR
jgi:hypothetical protein